MCDSGRAGLVVRALAFHQCGPGSTFRTRLDTWIEFVGSLLCSERFFPGFSGFPLSSKSIFDLTRFKLWNNNCKKVILNSSRTVKRI